jgi:uncharacterized membrane protein
LLVIGPFAHLLIALIVAGLVHLTSVLAMPWLATRDGFHRINGLVADNRMAVLAPAQVRENMPWSDPAVAIAACRYVLDKGPVRVRVAVGATPLTMILLRRGGGIFHSVSDKAATQGILEVVIATEEQMDLIAELDVDDEPVQEIRVVSQDDYGVVLLRGLVPMPSQRADVEAMVGGATCEAERLDQTR